MPCPILENNCWSKCNLKCLVQAYFVGHFQCLVQANHVQSEGYFRCLFQSCHLSRRDTASGPRPGAMEG